MVTYGFFNSVDGDRRYTADQMSNYFKGLISDGVYEGLGSALVVTAGDGQCGNRKSHHRLQVDQSGRCGDPGHFPGITHTGQIHSGSGEARSDKQDHEHHDKRWGACCIS